MGRKVKDHENGGRRTTKRQKVASATVADATIIDSGHIITIEVPDGTVTFDSKCDFSTNGSRPIELDGRPTSIPASYS